VVSDVSENIMPVDTIDRNKILLFSGTKPSLQHNLMLEPVPDLLTDTTPTSRCVCVSQGSWVLVTRMGYRVHMEILVKWQCLK
jgi:hypothetical protein